MNDSTNPSRPESGLYYVIPSIIFECKELEHSEVVFFALISGLSNKHGYCFASDEYLGERMKVDERSIRRWLAKLEKLGFVEKQTEKKGMYWDRKIYVFPLVSKSFYERACMSGSNGHLPNGRPCPDREDAHVRIVGEEELVSKSVCYPPPKASDSQEKNEIGKESVGLLEKIVKTSPEGKVLSLSLSDFILDAIQNRETWSTKEIHEAWRILSEYSGAVRDLHQFLRGTIKNFKQKKRSEFLAKEGKSWTNEDLAKYDDSKEKSLDEDTRELPSLGSLLQGVTMSIHP